MRYSFTTAKIIMFTGGTLLVLIPRYTQVKGSFPLEIGELPFGGHQEGVGLNLTLVEAVI